MKAQKILRLAMSITHLVARPSGVVMVCAAIGMVVSTMAVAVAAEPQAAVDVPALIRQASVKHQGAFKLSEARAVSQMDGMLVQQYAAAGRIATEKNAQLKALYYQAATLLLNGFPIAGGTVVAIARNQPAFGQSGAGRGLANFVDAMLAGDEDEDPELVQYMQRTKKAQAVLRPLRPELQLVAQLRVVGEIYHDDIAVDAGKDGLAKLNATAAERKVVEMALGAK